MISKTLVKRMLAGAQRLKQEYDQVQGIATVDTLKRIRVLVILAAPLHAALGWWFGHYHAPKGEANLQAWADALTWLQYGLSAAVTVCGLLTHLLLRINRAVGFPGLMLQIVFCGAYLAFGAAAAILDVSIGNGIGTFLVVCMGAATLSLMRPVFSALLYAATFGMFWAILRKSAVDPTLLSALQIQAISTVLVAQLISVMMWHQYTRTVLLGRKLLLSNEALLHKQLELETLAERDTLTGLYNRRKFMALAAQELTRTLRIPSSVGVLMVDLDFFKQVNDQWGHPVGDQVLQEVASRLLANVRSSDTVARMGGEEFIVLTPDTDRAGALALAEKLRLALRECPLQLADRAVLITASFGVTGLGPQQHTTLEALYSAADQALYVAKKQGRDRVEWEDPLNAETMVGESTVNASGLGPEGNS